LAETEYNAIAGKYTEATKRPMRIFAYEPTVVEYIKEEIVDANVLDLACGDGVSSRLFKKMGAKSVLGLDISKDLINIANSIPVTNIKYEVADVFSKSLSEYGQFDVVTAIMLIHYANNKEELKFFVKNVSTCLKSKGIFYLLTVNPLFLKNGYENYGIKLSPSGPTEGSPVLVELSDFDWKKYCEFHINYYSQETYDSLFDKLGFDIEWLPGVVSPEGIKEYGKEFWNDLVENPFYMIIKAKKRN
jgi:SAM-dependent methyltransferase